MIPLNTTLKIGFVFHNSDDIDLIYSWYELTIPNPYKKQNDHDK